MRNSFSSSQHGFACENSSGDSWQSNMAMENFPFRSMIFLWNACVHNGFPSSHPFTRDFSHCQVWLARVTALLSLDRPGNTAGQATVFAWFQPIWIQIIPPNGLWIWSNMKYSKPQLERKVLAGWCRLCFLHFSRFPTFRQTNRKSPGKIVYFN